MPLSDEKRKKIKKLQREFIKNNKIDESKMGFMSENENLGVIKRLPSGFPPFDVLTNGGFVRGKVNRIYGGESAGKTTHILNSMGHWDKVEDDFFTAYLPSEKTFDREWAIKNGCNPDSLWVFESESAEENLDFCLKCADPENGVDTLVIDTLQALSSKKEIYNKSKERSVQDDSMALLPRLYSQFLRMYTAKSVDNLTLVLMSQVRTDLNPMAHGAKKATGGNAIDHYNMLSVKVVRMGKGSWPTSDLPKNSYAGKFVIDKYKVGGRFKGNEIPFYFYNGSLDRKFNIFALGKELGVHNGKTFKYIDDNEKEVEVSGRGFNELYNKIPDEAIDYMETLLNEAYERKVVYGSNG